MFRKVLIANRGAIACRIMKTLDRLGIASVAVYSDADRNSRHVTMAREAVSLGGSPVTESYLRADKILAAAQQMGADAIHPGYGFLSENPGFAEDCAAAGIAFIGPTPAQMRAFGLKHEARALAEQAGVPLAPGSGLLADVAAAQRAAQAIGYPVMIKSTAGGGGIGLQLCCDATQMEDMFERVARLARNNFKDAGIFLEKYIERGRHIEVQIFGDGRGQVVALGERDCSTQRRHQKIVEETPAPGLDPATRAALLATAVRLGETVAYANAGTVEFIFDVESGEFYFLEVNTRLQVEHGVTEQVTGVDLIEWMLRQAAGETFPMDVPTPVGASIQVRVYAEDPAKGFRPSTGLLSHVAFPDSARVESWVETGAEITPFYDPMIAKIIVTAADRMAAIRALHTALATTEIAGIETNLDYLRQLAADPMFVEGRMTTRSLEGFVFHPRSIDVLAAGTQTTVQDFPGRVGYWTVGVPPSGPMDALSFRLANRAVGNAPAMAGLEISVSGPTLQFNVESVICLTGAAMAARLDGEPVPFWQPVTVKAGAILQIGAIEGAGCRAYLAIRGGLDVPNYLGSKATFTLAKFGGHAGRALRIGDVLHIGEGVGLTPPSTIPVDLRPVIGHHWEIGVLMGPHGAPDFFTDADIAMLFETDWEVHYHSSRTGVRLVGPKPVWARSDGGEAGLHPSNIHDNAYAIGAIDFTGDTPVILGPDGPSLGGFVCPVTIIQAELWKIGQLRPSDRIRFRRMTPAAAASAELAQEQSISRFAAVAPDSVVAPLGIGADDAILAIRPARDGCPQTVYRRAGDKYVLIEYGPLVLDLELRFRVHALMGWLERDGADPAIIEMTPGIRSLQIHYDSRQLPVERLLAQLMVAEEQLPPIDDMEVPTRVVYLPLSWDDAATQLAIEKYMQTVRPDAPWCPSNIEFIRQINGLESVEAVKQIVFDASYLVLGLGDVYLGAPVATPIDPRHRLVTTKYNPARTWTPDNAVGIGGAYLCVYGMEGPGGYQFVGRTCQMWNSHRVTAEFEPERPWLLRFFDQIRFFPVSGQELLQFRADFIQGRAKLLITHETFRLRDYRRFLADNADSIADAKARQQEAFEAERGRWAAMGASSASADLPAPEEDDRDDLLPENCHAAFSPVAGNVWKVVTGVGQPVAAGDVVIILESMKTELQVVAPADGRVTEIRCAEGRDVGLGQCLVVIGPA